MLETMMGNMQLVARIIVAGICGIAIGYERKNRAKDAGVRTHCIVACASALMMIISKYGFMDFFEMGTSLGDVRLDPSRMAQGIVTGVGFLGSGMIFVQRGSTRGLTTAAGIWATSGIGMALGAGMYFMGIMSTMIVLAVQFFFHFKSKLMIAHKAKRLTITGVTEEGFEEKTVARLSDMGISVTDISASKNAEGAFDYKFYIEVLENISEEKLLMKFDYPCAIDSVK